MLKSIRVKIGGKEYTLRGEDEQKLISASAEVDAGIADARQSMTDQSTTTHAVFAALNIAESKYEHMQLQQRDTALVIAELNRMTEYLEHQLNR